MNIPQEAVEAAYNAFQHPNRMLVNTSEGNLQGRLEAALEAALPHIEKEIRTQIAAEMKRRDNDYLKFANRFGGYYMGLQSAFHEATRIAEGVE